jgi:hypothetical protein
MDERNKHQLVVEVLDRSPAENSKDAIELRDLIRRLAGPNSVVEISKWSQETQDFGTILTIALATPFAAAVAQGLRDFIAKRGCRIEVRLPEGSVVATGSAGANLDVAKLVAALRAN